MATNDAPNPHEFHKRPSKTKGPCPICGCPASLRGIHRRVHDPDAKHSRFVQKRKGADGWEFEVVDTTPKTPDRPKVRTRKVRRPRKKAEKSPRVSSARLRENIIKACTMTVTKGKSSKEVAEAFGIAETTLYDWKREYADLWKKTEEALADQIIAVVRAQVGTDAILGDVDLYLHHANLAEKWCNVSQEPLFPVTKEQTLCTFFEEYYKPTCLSGAAPSTLNLYSMTLKRWRLLTGDPPLKDIDVPLLARFRDALAKCRGMKKWKRMSPSSIAGKMRQIQTILDKAGPPGYRNRDAAGVIETSPWCRAPKQEARPVRIVTPEEIDKVYNVACLMEQPKLEHLKPAQWWRALLVVTWNTGLRRGTLFKLTWDMVDWENRVFRIPGDSMKSKRWQVQPFNETAERHLRGIRRSYLPETSLIFPWSQDSRQFHIALHKLLDLAGIPEEEHFGLHDIRKTLATTLWTDNPNAASLALGHTNSSVTARHYVEQMGIVAKAVNELKQPAAFGQRNEGAA